MISLADKITLSGFELRLVAKGDGFIEMFYFEMKNNPNCSNSQIFEMLEKKHCSIIGENRYPSYESFVKAKARYLRKGQKRK